MIFIVLKWTKLLLIVGIDSKELLGSIKPLFETCVKI